MSAAPPDPAFHFYYYALENGYYEQEGFKVDVEAIPVETNSLRAVAAGDRDAGNPGTASTLKAIGSGAKLRIAASFWSADYLIMAKQEIPDLKGLEGHTMAVSGVGAAVHTFATLMMQQRGVDPDKVSWVAPGSSAARMQALVGGRTDAAILSSTFTAQAMSSSNRFHVITDSVNDLPNYPWCCEVVSENFATTKPELTQGLVNALSRAVRWMYRNPDDALRISQKLLPDTPSDALAGTIRRLIDKHIVNETGVITPERFNGLAGWMASTNQLPQKVRYEDAVLTQFTDAALKKLGPGVNG